MLFLMWFDVWVAISNPRERLLHLQLLPPPIWTMDLFREKLASRLATHTHHRVNPHQTSKPILGASSEFHREETPWAWPWTLADASRAPVYKKETRSSHAMLLSPRISLCYLHIPQDLNLQAYSGSTFEAHQKGCGVTVTLNTCWRFKRIHVFRLPHSNAGGMWMSACVDACVYVNAVKASRSSSSGRVGHGSITLRDYHFFKF